MHLSDRFFSICNDSTGKVHCKLFKYYKKEYFFTTYTWSTRTTNILKVAVVCMKSSSAWYIVGSSMLPTLHKKNEYLVK